MKRNTTKGFTLIELLAVIVILAIIALIAVPIILNIIDKANKSAFKDSAYGVLSAAEYYYAASQLELEGPTSTVDMDTTDSRLELKGSIPTGHVWITRDGEIAFYVYNERYCVTKGYGDKDITITEDGKNCKSPVEEDTDANQGTGGSGGNTVKTLSQLATTSTEVTSIPTCVTSGTECSIGTPIAIQVNTRDVYNFYVIEDKNNKVTLIMDRNLGENVAWIDGNDYAEANKDDGTSCSATSCDDEGPITLINALNDRTSDWNNITEKTYIVSGIGEDGETRQFEDMEVTGRAKLLTYAEVSAESIGCVEWEADSCPRWMYINLNGTGDDSTYGYWLSTPLAGGYKNAYVVDYDGGLYDYSVIGGGRRGVRPVIEISK